MPETRLYALPPPLKLRRDRAEVRIDDDRNCQKLQNPDNGAMRRTLAAVAVLAAAATVCDVAGSSASGGGGGQQRFRAGVDLVHFSVIVTDKQGAPITGLTADDFELLEEGKPQSISYFSEG